MFTFIVLKNSHFFLHNPQKCITFASNLEKTYKATFVIKPKLNYETEFFHNEATNAGICPAFVH